MIIHRMLYVPVSGVWRLSVLSTCMVSVGVPCLFQIMVAFELTAVVVAHGTDQRPCGIASLLDVTSLKTDVALQRPLQRGWYTSMSFSKSNLFHAGVTICQTWTLPVSEIVHDTRPAGVVHRRPARHQLPCKGHTPITQRSEVVERATCLHELTRNRVVEPSRPSQDSPYLPAELPQGLQPSLQPPPQA